MKLSPMTNDYRYSLLVIYSSNNINEYYFNEIKPMKEFFNEHCIKNMNYARGYENINFKQEGKRSAKWQKILDPKGDIEIPGYLGFFGR